MLQWKDHPIWNDELLRGRCLDLMYTFLFRPKSAEPKRASSKREEPFEATVHEAVVAAISIWGRDKFVADDGDAGDDVISPEVVKSKYTAGIRKLLYGEIKRTGARGGFGTEGLDAFLLYCLKHSDPDAPKFERLRDRLNLWLLIPPLEDENYPSSLEAGVREALKNKRHRSVLGLLSGYFNVQKEESAAAAKPLTGVTGRLRRRAKDADRGYYYCYRYADTPGKVLKTFHVFTPSDVDYPYTRFQNFLDGDPDPDRISDGVVFELSGYLVGLGRVGNPGKMLKAMVLQKPDKNGCLSGITLSATVRRESVLAARVLLKPAPDQVQNHSNAHTGVFTAEQLVKRGELTSMDLWRIRNRVDYTLGGEVRNAKTDDPVVSLEQLITKQKELNTDGVFLRKGWGAASQAKEVDFLDPHTLPFDSVLREFALEHDGKPDDD
ncbi:MAG: hypothetical protein AAF636_08380 [Pseudomonadota bacterium]